MVKEILHPIPFKLNDEIIYFGNQKAPIIWDFEKNEIREHPSIVFSLYIEWTSSVFKSDNNLYFIQKQNVYVLNLENNEITKIP